MTERRKRDGVAPAGAGRWRISVNAGRDPETGDYIRHREVVVGSKREAIRRRNELRVDAARGTLVHAENETVADFLERWITHREHVGKVRPKTAYVYRGHVRRIVAPRIGSMRLADVRPINVQRVLDEALAEGASPRTVTQVHRILHAAFRQAVRWQALASNPSDGATPPKVEAAQLRMPTTTEVAAIFANVDPGYRVPLAVAAMTGLRRGEVLAISWGAVNLDVTRVTPSGATVPAPTLQVEGSLQRTGAGLEVLPPKTARSKRTVPIPLTLAATLRTHRDAQDERRAMVGEAWQAGEFVFDRGDGRPVDPDAFGKAFRDARDAAGVAGVRLHDLRHAFASMQIAEGTEARLVSDLLGHSTVAFTLQTYVHPSEDATATAAETTERVLGVAING